jgi:malate dehydrogenase
MCKAIFNDEKRLLAASAYLTGQYGIKDIYIGVPIIIGAKGVEKIYELKLDKDELSALQKSASTYREHLGILGY